MVSAFKNPTLWTPKSTPRTLNTSAVDYKLSEWSSLVLLVTPTGETYDLCDLAGRLISPELPPVHHRKCRISILNSVVLTNIVMYIYFFFDFYFILGVLGLKPGASHMLNLNSTSELHQLEEASCFVPICLAPK